MTASVHDSPGDASEQALEWFVLLQDDPQDAALRRRFEGWLAASPAHGDAWARTVRTSSLAESLLPFDARDWAVDGAVPDRDRLRAAVIGSPPASLPTSPKPARRRLMPTLWAAGTAALAGIALFLAAPSLMVRLQADYTTDSAALRDLVLEDGSRVALAPGSAVAVSFAPASRTVTLLKGEAFFEVKPDAARPFSVAARDVRTTVVGTAFDVRLDPDAVEVAVNEGKVRVDGAGRAESLIAGEALRLSDAGAAVRRQVAAESVAAWRQGSLVLEDRSFAASVAEVERYLPARIVIADGDLSRRPLTGVFDLRDPQKGLQAMADVLGARIRHVTPWLIVVSPR